MSLVYELTLIFFIFGWIVYLSPFLLTRFYNVLSIGKPGKVTWFVFWILIAFFTSSSIFKYYNNLKIVINVIINKFIATVKIPIIAWFYFNEWLVHFTKLNRSDMQISIEISLYPLSENFISPIENFISRLKKYDSIEVRTNNMSTQLFGEFDDLIKILKVEMEKTFKNETNSAFNLKIVNGDSRKYDLEDRA